MEQIIQLKSMRDAALDRLQNNPDFKLVNSLDALIRDLETVMVPVSESVAEEPVDQIEEINTDTDSFEIAATTDETFVTDSSEPAATSTPDTGSSDENSADTEVETAIEDLSETAANQPDDAALAIEALEAELSQSEIASEEVAAQPGSMIN